jgi:DNA polymerase-3 subunit gamma/tau
MSYVVLARKYRPRTFEQMVGQDHVVRALTHALEQGRLHHAYLFTGTRGIGKTTVSRILAKSLNCTGPDGTGGVTAHPCGVCTACREIDADRYIDYTELDAASNRSIDEIRDLIERAAYKPAVGRYKVFMIDEAHQLTKDAFNALLKTLEEPPEYLKFVLATTDPEKMLPTVLSRCLQFNLRPMAPETVAAHLEHVLEAEHIARDAGSLRLLSRAARGSMRDALSLTDQAIAYGAGALEEAAVRTMLGSVDRSHANRLVGALARRDAAAVLGEADALRGRGLSASGTLEEMARLLQQMAVEQALPGALDATDGDTAAARELSGALAPDETQLLYSIALHGRAELSLAPDEYSGLVMVLLRFMAFPADGGAPRAVAPAARPAAAPAAPASTSASAPAAAPVPVAAVEPAPVAAPTPLPPAPAPAAAPLRRPDPAPRTASPASEPPPWDEPMLGDEDLGEAIDVLDALPVSRERDRDRDRGRDAPRAAAPRDRAERFEEPAGFDRVEPPVAATPIRMPAVPEFERTALGDRWYALVRGWSDAGQVMALVRELAVQAELIACDDAAEPPLWRLRVGRETLRNPALVDKLTAVLRTHAGATAVLEVIAGDAGDCPARRDAAEADRRQREAVAVIQADPVVSALMMQFPSARVLPGSIKPAS